MIVCFDFVTDLDDFSDEGVLEGLIQFHTVVYQHVLKHQHNNSQDELTKCLKMNKDKGFVTNFFKLSVHIWPDNDFEHYRIFKNHHN